MYTCVVKISAKYQPIASCIRSYQKLFHAKCYSNAAIDHCVQLIRKEDRISYLSALTFPAEVRPAVFSILAFNEELKMIRRQCNNNVMAGRMRFQWWRSILDDIYTNAEGERGGDRVGKALSQHPVIEMLSETVVRYPLTKRWFERLIEVCLVSCTMMNQL